MAVPLRRLLLELAVLVLLLAVIGTLPRQCLCSSPALFLPLQRGTVALQGLAESKTISSGPSSKLPFRHNVTLTVSLAVGTPPQNVTMVLDTGSELSWLRCRKGPNMLPVFNPQASTSYHSIPCASEICRVSTRHFPTPVSCNGRSPCRVSLSYADFSSMEGNLANDRFSMGSSVQRSTISGCVDSASSTNTEEDSKTTGLMGLNRGSFSFVNQMKLPKFAYCISGSDSSGVLVLGEAALPWLKALSYTPFVRESSNPLPYFDPVAYSVQLEGIRVSNVVLPLPRSDFQPDHTGAGQTTVDSGTQFTFLLGRVYTALKNEFMTQTKGKLTLLGDPNFVFQGAMDLCYRVGKATNPQSLAMIVPPVTLMFRGAEMRVSGEKLLYKVPGLGRGSDNVYCFTFGNSDLLGIEAFIIGNHHQHNMWMEFDLANSRLGLAEVRCDVASQKLGLRP